MSDPTRTEKVTVDGGSFDLHVWLPPQTSGPGILLIQEIFGVGDYIKAVAARLARDGYVVAAPDLFWRISPGWAAPHDEAGMAGSFDMVGKFDFEQGVGDAVAALGALKGLDEVRGGTGVLGFCLGGTIAHYVGVAADPDAVVSYYGSGVADGVGQLSAISCPVLYHFGGKDDFIPPEQIQTVVDAVEASGRDDVRVDVHAEAGHAFDNHEAPMFHDVNAAAEAWAATGTFLAEHLDRGA
jgi:carboxymethylenebutenolidase